MTTELDWNKAKKHFDETFEGYRALIGQPGVNVMLALSLVFVPLLRRYENGERTQELYDEMMSVE